jgi:hypothetical protein
MAGRPTNDKRRDSQRTKASNGSHRRSSAGPVEVRPETVRGSGRKAARRDLEAGFPLGDQTAFQDGLVANHEESVANENERAATERQAPLIEHADVESELGWREAEVDDLNTRIGDAEGRRIRLPKVRQAQQVALSVYLMLLTLFAVAEYPLLRLSFTRLPVDDTTIRVISVLVGSMLVATVHVLGLVAARVVQAEGERVEGRRDWRLQMLALAIGGLLVVGAVVGLAVLRGSEIAAVGAAFHGLGVGHPFLLGAALGFLHGLVLLAAFYLAYHRARGAEWRAITKEIRVLEQARVSAEARLEELERQRERLLVEVALIEERHGERLERLLRHHQHEEAEYLAILRRERDQPPPPISSWITRAALPGGPKNGSWNGKPVRTTAARRVKRLLNDRPAGTQDGKETP